MTTVTDPFWGTSEWQHHLQSLYNCKLQTWHNYRELPTQDTPPAVLSKPNCTRLHRPPAIIPIAELHSSLDFGLFFWDSGKYAGSRSNLRRLAPPSGQIPPVAPAASNSLVVPRTVQECPEQPQQFHPLIHSMVVPTIRERLIPFLANF